MRKRLFLHTYIGTLLKAKGDDISIIFTSIVTIQTITLLDRLEERIDFATFPYLNVILPYLLSQKGILMPN